MKTFITSIFVQTNSLSTEKICVGLFAITPQKVHFAVSKKKLDYACKILGKDLCIALNKTFTSFDEKVLEFNNSSHQKSLVEKFDYFSKDYFVYLNKYSKGLTQFAAPKPFAGEINDTVFAELFEKFVGDELPSPGLRKTENQHTAFKRYIKQTLELPAFEKTDIYYPVSPNIVKGILAHTNVDFICKNGSIIAGNAIDFTQAANTIEKNVNELALLAIALDKFAIQHNLQPSEYNLYCAVPDTGTDQYTMFENTKYNLPFKIHEPQDLEKTADTIAKGKVMPFSQFIHSLGLAV